MRLLSWFSHSAAHYNLEMKKTNRLTTWSVYLAVSFVLLVHSAFAQYVINFETATKAAVFIYGSDDGVHPNTRPMGTGFFVEIPLKKKPHNVYRVLVTARHVVDPAWLSCPSPAHPEMLFLRLNTKNFDPEKDDTGVEFKKLTLGQDATLFKSVDDSVDAAVIVVPGKTLDLNMFDQSAIGMWDLANSKILGDKAIGLETVSPGLLYEFAGTRRNYQVLRFGHIASIPYERVPTACGPGLPPRLLRVWFIAANQTPGTSGAPVYTSPGQLSGLKPALVGVQSSARLNDDIAFITPIAYVVEILRGIGFEDADLDITEKPQPENGASPAKTGP
jgi:hypothetical protein